MRIFTCIFLYLYFFRNSECSSTFIMDRMFVSERNDKYLIVSARVSKIDKTRFAINLNFTILQDLDDLSIHIKIFALFSNEYRPMPVEIKKRVCDVWNFEFKWIEQDLRKSSKFPDSCHIKKGEYYIKNYIPNTSKFPAKSPWEHVKFSFRLYLTETNETVSVTEVYAHVDKY